MFRSKHVHKFRAWEYMKLHSSVSDDACLCSSTANPKQPVMITNSKRSPIECMWQLSSLYVGHTRQWAISCNGYLVG